MSAPIPVSSTHRRQAALFAVLTLSCGAFSGLAGGAAQAIEPPPALPANPAALLIPGPSGATASTAAAGLTPTSLPAPITTTAISSSRRILLELGRRTISLYDGDKKLGSWPVAIGDPATPTPTGSFKIRNKVINPQYQSTKSGKNNPITGPNGPLGDRWMGFHTTARDQFGIHGTPPAWAWAVNTRAAVSHGCVRMLNPHVHALFDQVEVGTLVVVKN
ncbi:MAG: L,D-transpeptidase [Cyanobacteria bacterium]|nr:L,D-transpeptidase [Cyanobacteriota bacterium]